MNRCGVAAIAASMIFCLSGCATVMNGTHENYQVRSEPEGAEVRFTDGHHCTTPCKVKLKRKDDERADFSLAEYDPTYVLVRSKLGGTTFGNVIAGGLVGGVVDASNGASNKLTPEPLMVRLAHSGSGDEAMLLDKKGKVKSTVQEYNNSVRVDVAKSIGPKLAGLGEESSKASDDTAESNSEEAADSSK